MLEESKVSRLRRLPEDAENALPVERKDPRFRAFADQIGGCEAEAGKDAVADRRHGWTAPYRGATVS